MEYDVSQILTFLDVQLHAYPPVNTLVFDFVEWDQKEVVKPYRVLPMHCPFSALERIQEVIIRGLSGEQLGKVVERVTPFVKNGGRIGTTSSHYSLTDDGRFARANDEQVKWQNTAWEEKRVLAEDSHAGSGNQKMRRAEVFERKA